MRNIDYGLTGLTQLRGLRRSIELAVFILFLAQFTFIHPQTGTVRFAVIGDFGSGNNDERDVADRVKSWNPDFIITVGDNNYPLGRASTIDQNIGQFYHEFIFPYTGIYGPGSATNRFWPSIGNRDWDTSGAQPYLDYFTLPGNERYYDYVRGPVHFFVIDSDDREPDGNRADSVQANWLRNALAASNAVWKVVYLHHPPYSSRTSHSRLQWDFQEWGATAVIAGHAHLYERIMRNGFPYITNGLGGESLGTFGTPIAGSTVRFGTDYGAQLVTASNNTITFQFITRAGVVIDDYSITSVAPSVPSNVTASAVSSSQVNLLWTDTSNNESGFNIERCQGTNCSNFAEIGQAAMNVAAFSDTGLAAGTLYRYRVRSFNNVGSSAYSNIAGVTTQSPPPPPSAPSNLAPSAVSSSQVSLSWTDNSNSEVGFKIERCQNAACSDFAEIVQVGANIVAFTDSGRTAETTYRYRVRAFNNGGNSGFSNTIQVITSPPTASTLSDDFNDNVRDTGKWDLGLFSRSSSNFDPLVQVVEQNGQLSIAPRVSQTGNRYNGYVSVTTWDLTGSVAVVEVAQKATGNAATIFSVGIDKDNWYGFRAKANSLIFESRRNGITTDTAITFNAVQHRFWRVRHDTALDTINFETSADSVNWTVRRSVARQITITSVRVELVAGTGEAVSAPGTALFDNFLLEIMTSAVSPIAPSNLVAAAVSSSQINLTWTDNSSDEDSFKIERCQNAGCANFVEVTQVGENVTTYGDTALAANTIFRYRVRAFNSGADSGYSNIAEMSTTTAPETPEPPTNLVASAVSSTQINLTWTSNSDTEDGFRIERCMGVGCSDFAQIAQTVVDVVSFSDTGLNPATTYGYRVRAFNGGGNSAYTNIAGSTTQSPPPVPPAAPSNLSAAAVSATQINLSWTDGSNNEDGFKIERCQDTGCSNFVEINQAVANAVTFNDPGRATGTIYRYRIRAFNSAGNSAYSNISEAATQSAPPIAPTGLTASAFSATQINLTWADNASDEIGFKIERCQNTGCSNFAEINQVGSDTAVYADTGLSPDTTYVYRVRAFNAAGNSLYSNLANATTPATPPSPPTAPGGLSATGFSSSQINLTWVDNSNNENGFKVERCQGTQCTNFAEINQTAANTVTFSDGNRTAATTYNYRVRAFNGGGNSSYSNTSEASTSASTSTFGDDFDDGVRDQAKWDIDLLSRNVSNFDPTMQVLEQGGRLSIAPQISQSGNLYSGYVSAAAWNLTDTNVRVEAVQKASGNAVTIFTAGIDKDNWFSFRAKGNSLFLESRVSGTTTSTTLRYDAALHRFWRLRHIQSTDSIVFETSADSVTWSLGRTVARQIAVTGLKIELAAGTGESVAAPGTALFDNLLLGSN